MLEGFLRDPRPVGVLHCVDDGLLASLGDVNTGMTREFNLCVCECVYTCVYLTLRRACQKSSYQQYFGVFIGFPVKRSRPWVISLHSIKMIGILFGILGHCTDP